MNRMCCPHYTIRCEALNFKLRKSHKKVLKKVNKYLIHGIKPTSDDKDEELEAPNDKAGDKSKEKDKSDKLEKSHDSEGTSVDIKPADETSATSSGSQHKTPRKGNIIITVKLFVQLWAFQTTSKNVLCAITSPYKHKLCVSCKSLDNFIIVVVFGV